MLSQHQYRVLGFLPQRQNLTKHTLSLGRRFGDALQKKPHPVNQIIANPHAHKRVVVTCTVALKVSNFMQLFYRLNIEPEMHHVPILDDIFLSLQPHPARFLGTLLAFRGDEVVITDDFGADKTLFEIGVDDSGGLGRGISS
jgi:hypothetical protein